MKIISDRRSWTRTGGTLVAALAIVLLAISAASCSRNLTKEQKLSDFRHLFAILRDNHPYLSLKARTEGYDWLAHEKEFEESVRSSKNDKEFAAALQRMLLMTNSGHTSIVSPAIYRMITGGPPEMKPWQDEAAKTDAETVKRWFSHAVGYMTPPKGKALPFRALYCQGEYIVYWASEALAAKHGIAPGHMLESVDGVSVHEFVKSQRGKIQLSLDPSRKRLFQAHFSPAYTKAPLLIGFKDASGKPAQAKVRFEDAKPGITPTPLLPTHMGYSQSNLSTAKFENGKIAYVHVRQMSQYHTSQGDAQTLREFFSEIKNTEALIIDIRCNGGGDDRFWMLNIVRPLAIGPVTWTSAGVMRAGEYAKSFIKANMSFADAIDSVSFRSRIIERSRLASELTEAQAMNFPPEALGPEFGDPVVTETTILPSGEHPYEGKIFVLVDGTVFSSAESFARFCKSSGWATLIGEHTKGGQDGITPVIVTLPSSKITVFFPVGMGLNADFTANAETHTKPDVIVERGLDDLVRHTQALNDKTVFMEPDPAYDAALRECLRMALVYQPRHRPSRRTAPRRSGPSSL